MSRRHSILLVEDEVGIREAFALLLELEGYSVHTAVDGMDAMDVLARTPVDLVITDYMMPRLDGIELARTLRQRDDATGPAVVLITAASAAAAMGEPLDAVLTKPVDAGRLLQTIARLLDRPQDHEG